MISAFDTENKQDGTFIMGVCCDDKGNTEVFREGAKLRSYLKRIGGTTFANNLFYDFGNLYTGQDWETDLIEINSGRTVIRQGRFVCLKFKGYKTNFFDLFNYRFVIYF